MCPGIIDVILSRATLQIAVRLIRALVCYLRRFFHNIRNILQGNKGVAIDANDNSFQFVNLEMIDYKVDSVKNYTNHYKRTCRSPLARQPRHMSIISICREMKICLSYF